VGKRLKTRRDPPANAFHHAVIRRRHPFYVLVDAVIHHRELRAIADRFRLRSGAFSRKIILTSF
jgi:hypothetical protein